MSLEDFAAMLETTGLPVAYLEWPEDEAPPLPYICYLETGADPFFADGTVYTAARRIQVELYCDKRDVGLEASVEAVLSLVSPWEKTIEYLSSERCYEILYEMEV